MVAIYGGINPKGLVLRETFRIRQTVRKTTTMVPILNTTGFGGQNATAVSLHNFTESSLDTTRRAGTTEVRNHGSTESMNSAGSIINADYATTAASATNLFDTDGSNLTLVLPEINNKSSLMRINSFRHSRRRAKGATDI